MRLTDIVPAYLIPALMWLGKQDWLDYGLGPGKTTRIAVRRIAVPTKDARLFDGVMKILQQPTGSLVRWNAISKAVAFGPKLLCPTSNQCQAMEHTDLNLPVTEYRQPYPAVFLQLPGDYRTELAQRFGIPCPKYILAFHDLKTGYILTNTFGANPNTEIVAIVSPHPEIQTIEDGLSERVDDGQDIVLADVVTRIALNLCLLMVHFGVEEVPSRHRQR